MHNERAKYKASFYYKEEYRISTLIQKVLENCSKCE